MHRRRCHRRLGWNPAHEPRREAIFRPPIAEISTEERRHLVDMRDRNQELRVNGGGSPTVNVVVHFLFSHHSYAVLGNVIVVVGMGNSTLNDDLFGIFRDFRSFYFTLKEF